MRSPFPPLAPRAWLRWDQIQRMIPTDVKTVVEMGSGQGGVAARLARDHEYTGYEPDEVSFRVAQARLAQVGRGRLVPDFAPDRPDHADPFDMLATFEVLEHIEDDGAALASWKTWIRPGGHLLISVPAHSHRFGPADVYAGHFRRYDRSDLVSVIEDAGLKVEDVRIYGFPLTYLTEWIWARLATTDDTSMVQKTSRSGRVFQPKDWMAPIIGLLIWPFRLLQRPFIRSDLGSGYVVLASKPL